MRDCIGVFSDNVENWGAERSVCAMCEALQKKGEKVLVIIPRLGKIVDLLKNINVEYLVCPFSKWVYSNPRSRRPDVFFRYCLRQFFDGRKIVHEVIRRGYKPKLVYSAVILIGVGIYCAKKWTVPHLHHFRETVDTFGYKFLLGYKRSLAYINNNSNGVICTCKAIQNRYKNDIDSKKFFVINNGVPPVENFPCKKKEGILRIVQVARFMDDKRVIDSLEAVKLIINRGITTVKLDLFGQGEGQSLYENFIRTNNLEQYIEIKGFVQNIDFSPYHIGLMTSTFEAFARTTLDYMNNGLAVIASNAGGNLEQMKDGVTGLLFEVHNPLDLAEKILFLHENRPLITQMGIEGRNRFLNLFTQSKYQEHIGAVILSFLK